jgi:phosphoribosylformylglycinamidine synthase subunit PurS
MQYTIEVNIMPLKQLLDPKGKATTQALHQLGFQAIEQVRIGKCISLTIEAESAEAARAAAQSATQQLLCNPVMEYAVLGPAVALQPTTAP